MRSLLALSALALLGLLATPGTAGAVDTFRPNDPCDTLGATHMSVDNTGLVICALNNGVESTSVTCNTLAGGGCTWKSMSGGDVASGDMRGFCREEISTIVMCQTDLPPAFCSNFYTCACPVAYTRLRISANTDTVFTDTGGGGSYTNNYQNVQTSSLGYVCVKN